jgi:competence protein ComEC
VGAEIVIPALQALGRGLPDTLIISHADNDHSGGAESLAERYPDMHVLGGPDVGAIADEHCRAGQVWLRDEVRFEVLHPAEGFGPIGNESSCVLRVVTGNGSLLVTGDVERIAENRLVQTADLSAAVVIVPHHGSLTSSTVPFVAAVDATVAIVSAGFNNRWGFPRPEVSERWRDSGAELLVTGSDGAITGYIDRHGITVSVARDRRRRFWQPERDLSSGASEPSAL